MTWKRIKKFAALSIAFAICAHIMMDAGTAEPWAYMGLYWWGRTIKAAFGIFLGTFFWEVLRASLRNGGESV